MGEDARQTHATRHFFKILTRLSQSILALGH